MITVFTPAYNRLDTLKRLYDSLCRQDCHDFEWLVVDDGSNDGTKEYFESLEKGLFDIRYYHKGNEGKHRTINYGVRLAKGEWFFIVDSDDYLTENAISVIGKRLRTIENDNRFCGITGLRVDTEGKTIGTECGYETLDTDFVSYRTRYMISGDRAEIIRTTVMKEFPFPEFENEKFCTEAIVWNRMAQKYICRFVNDGFYVCEYQENGLTSKYWEIMDKNPIGATTYYKELMLYRQTSLKHRMIGFMCYRHFRKLVGKDDVARHNLELPWKERMLYGAMIVPVKIFMAMTNKKIITKDNIA